MTIEKGYYRYVNDIQKGNIVSCKSVRLAIDRFERDIKASQQEEFPYYFDEKQADKVIRFVETMKQYEGDFAGLPLKLEPWQQFIVANIHGWRRKADKVRRFTKAFIFVARKNGKTILASTLALYDLLTEPGAQVYSAATRRDQAAIAFKNVVQFIKYNPTLQQLLKLYRNSIVYEKTASKFEALSKEFKGFDGLNPSLILLDEVAAQTDADLLNVLTSGQYSRVAPLSLLITTGHHSLQTVGRLEYEGAQRLLDKSIGVKDERTFAILYELDEGDDWRDESVWIKANPNLGVSVKLEHLLSARDNAITMPHTATEFKVKNCNLWLSGNSSWITDQDWLPAIENIRENEITPELLADAPCCAAVDLSKRNDITAYTKYFWIEAYSKYYAEHRFYIPKEQIVEKMKTDSLLIQQWVDEGIITAIPGRVIDYNVLYDDIKADLEQYRIHEIAFDNWNSLDLQRQIGPLTTLYEFPQNYKNMSSPSKDWEASILRKEIIDANPVMRWMVGCAGIYIDPNGNIKPVKSSHDPSSSQRIDGVVTSIMAMARLKALMQGGEVETEYSVDDFFFG
jgi:phage terminase large subunit-like protein